MKTCARGHTREDKLVHCPTCKKATSTAYYKNNKNECKNKTNAWRKKNPDRVRSIWLKSIYGITGEQYRLMFDNQDGNCAICYRHQDRVNKTFCVDHDHTTGKIRELLCEDCNLALGTFNDDPIRFENAASYLRKHKKF